MNKGETMQAALERLERDLAAANLRFEEAREIIAQVSYSPEMKKHFYDGHWQDPHGVHAFTAKYAQKEEAIFKEETALYLDKWKERAIAAELKNGEQARAIRNVQRALERNENREINMGQAWELIKEAVAVKRKCEKHNWQPDLSRGPGSYCQNCNEVWLPT